MNLREIRLERGLSVPKLVELSGVPRRTIQEIENRNDCRVSTAIHLADALGITLDELCKVSIPEKTAPALSIYPACFCKEENGYSVFFPDLNWLATCGDNLEDAMMMAIDCLAGYLYDCLKDGTALPASSDLSDVHPENYLKELYGNTELPPYFVNLVPVDVKSYAREHCFL